MDMETKNIRQDRVSVTRVSKRRASALALLLMLLLMLLGVAACSTQASAPKGALHATATATTVPTATTAPTATPVPSLAFRTVPLPSGFSMQTGSIAVSPVDGQVAWACVSLGSNAFTLWMTTSAGATWEAAGAFHPITPEPTNGCGLTANQRDPQSAVFTAWWGHDGEASDLGSMSFYTRDRGQHWAQLPGWLAVRAVETDGAATYALITVITPPPKIQASLVHPSASSSRLAAPNPSNQQHMAFVVSNNGLQTWRELYIGGSPTPNLVYEFWHSPTTNDLFAAPYNGDLWHSPDDGVNWTQPNAQDIVGSQITLGAWVANHQAWMFCASQGLSSATLCSTDSGAAWHEVPALPDAQTCDQRCRTGNQTATCRIFALRPDGSLLTVCPPFFGTYEAGQVVLYRLALGANSWTLLGLIPSLPRVVPTNGPIWCTQERYGEWDTLTLPA